MLIDPVPVSGEIGGAAEQLIAAVGDARIVMRDGLRPVAEDLDRLERATAALERLLRQSGVSGERTPAAGSEGFMIRAIATLAGYGATISGPARTD